MAENRAFSTPLAFDDSVGKGREFSSEYWRTFGMEKTRMVSLPDGNEIVIDLDVSMEYRRVTDRQTDVPTDRHTDRQTSCDNDDVRLRHLSKKSYPINVSQTKSHRIYSQNLTVQNYWSKYTVNNSVSKHMTLVFRAV